MVNLILRSLIHFFDLGSPSSPKIMILVFVKKKNSSLFHVNSLHVIRVDIKIIFLL